MDVEKTVFCILLFWYLVYSFYARFRILNAHYISQKRKKLHLWFIWIVPIAGPLLIRIFWKSRSSPEVNTKAKRKNRSNHFYESQKGFYGE